MSTDEQHYVIATSLDQSIADLSERLDDERKAPGGIGQEALDRDLEIHRLTARLRTLRRFGLDLCLGRIVSAADPEPVYIGRLGLTDSTGRRLLLDWRSPAAEPFFGATHANPMGLASRRRYRWTRGRITDYWDEVFALDELGDDGFEGHAALDDQSAFIASLGSNRSADARRTGHDPGRPGRDHPGRSPARSSSTAVLVPARPSSPCTTAYLLYSDPRLGHHRGGVLFVGPSEPHHLAYVSDVLPSLGEEGVQTATLRDLVPQGARAGIETDPRVALLKIVHGRRGGDRSRGPVLRGATALGDDGRDDSSDIRLSAADWAEAFETPDPGTPHNDARDQVWESVLSILQDKYDGDEPADLVRKSLRQNRELLVTFNRAWPLLEATDLVDLWSVPAYLRRCAPWLSADDVRTLQRADPTPGPPPTCRCWTRPAIGSATWRRPGARGGEAIVAAERERMALVIDELIATDDSELLLMTTLRHGDLREALVDEAALPQADPGPARPVRARRRRRGAGADRRGVADAAAPLSVAELHHRRGPRPGSARVRGVGQERLGRIGLHEVNQASLTINYRTPEEVMAEAGRSSGRPPGRHRADLDPEQRRPRRVRIGVGAGHGPRLLAGRACRGRRDRVRHR